MKNEFEIKNRIRIDIIEAICYGPANELEVRISKVVDKIYKYMEIKNGKEEEKSNSRRQKGSAGEQGLSKGSRKQGPVGNA